MVNNLIGRRIGPYKLQEKLGTGGMGTVYKAVHIDSKQIVALKVLHEQFSENPNIRLRFEREAKIASELEHRHIVPMLDFGEFKDYVYLAMPFMEGGSLATALSEKTLLHYNISLEMLAFLADALDYAHSRGVIHRDFKLENILLDKMSSPAISDFGIAQSADTTNITSTGQMLGSPLYLAPESFTDGADYRLDLYAFAVTAYLLFTGYFPFTSPNLLSILDKHKTAALPLPSQVNPQLSTRLDEIFSTALAKEPAERFSSARELISQLDMAFATIPPGAVMISLNEENPLGLSVETPISIRQALKADEVTRIAKIVPSISSVYKKLKSREYRKYVTPIFLGGVLSACLALSTGAQYLIPNWNFQSANHDLDEFQAGQTLIASQRAGRYETDIPTSLNTPTPIIEPSSTKPAGSSQSEPLSVPTLYVPPVIHDNHRPQPRSARVNNQVIVPTNPPVAVNPQPNNPQPTNPPRNNGGGGNGGNGGNGGGGNGGNGGNDGGSGRDGGSGGGGRGGGRDGGSGGGGRGGGRDGGSGGGGRGGRGGS